MLKIALLCLALNVYYVARNQPLQGQMAVAEVVMNRVVSNNFPDTVCEVIQEGPTYSWKPEFPVKNQCQFSWYCDGKSDMPIEAEAWETALIVAKDILANRPTVLKGSTYYHAIDVAPKWAETKTFVKRVGDHLFYK